MSRHLELGIAVLLGLTAFALLLALPSWAVEQPRPRANQPAAPSDRARNQILQADSSTLLSEDFEHDGDLPPGWEVFTTTINGWTVVNNAFSRDWSAYVPNIANLDEVLISPDLDVYSRPAQVTFWARRAVLLNQTLTLWVILDEWDAGLIDDEKLVADVMDDLPTTNWTELTYAIPPSYPGTIRLGWQYATVDGRDFYLDDVLVTVQQPEFIPPDSHVVAPYKVEPGDTMTYVLVLSNTGQLPATAAVVSDALPAGVSHVAGSAYWSARGAGVISTAFTDTASLVEWRGVVPTATGLLITIPVQIVAAPGETISNAVIVDDHDIVDPFLLVGQTRVYPTGTLAYSESFNDGPGGWQGNNDWEWGRPLTPLDAPHSWPAAWGTNLGDGTNGFYDRTVNHVLSTTLDLSSYPPTYTYLLQWWESFAADGIDEGLVRVNGTTVYQVQLDRSQWTERLVNLADFAGQTITVTYVLSTAGIGESATGGWYVDDVALHVLPPVAAFDGSWKRADRTKVAPGGQLTYTLYLTNSGHAPSTQGHLNDALPAGLQVSQVYSRGNGRVTSGSDYVEWFTTETYSMPVGADATITVVVDVSPDVACGTALLNSTVVSEVNAYAETALEAPTVHVYPGDVHYASLLDADDGGLTQQGGVWAWGASQPYGDGPAWDGDPAHTAPHVWGTNLGGDAPDVSASAYTLTLAVVDLSAAGQLPLAFQWWDWYEPGDPAHVGKALVSSDQLTVPVEVYRAPSDQPTGWQHHSLDLSDWAGHSAVQVRFVYTTDGDGTTGPGWYIDSLALHDACPQLHLRPSGQTGAGCRGLEASYTLDVFNWDRAPTRVDLSLSGNAWPVGITPALTVPAATTSTLVITVAVPDLGDMSDVVTIEAVADNGLTATARITTTATITAHWQPMAPLPERRASHAVVALDGALYAIGGLATGDQPVSTTYRYDPTADAWTEVAALPAPLSHGDGVALNGEIFVPGGQTSGGVYTQTTFVYSPTLDSWRTITADPAQVSPTIGYEVVAWGGQLVRLGGYLSPTLVVSQVRALNPATGQWSALPALPAPRADFAAGVNGGQIVVAGGFDGATRRAVTDTQVYSGGLWSAADPLPTTALYDRWTGPGDADFDGWLYLVGGARSEATLDHTGRYSVTTGDWDVTPDLPRLRQPRQDLEAAAVNGTIYAVGGRGATGAPLSNANERLVFCPVCTGLSSVSIDYDFVAWPGETQPVDGQVVTFTASFEPALASKPMLWEWDWDDGTPGDSGQQATHAFYGDDPDRVDPQDFYVVVTGTNCAGPAQRGDWVSVASVPVYSMSLEANDPVEGQPGDVKTRVINVFNFSNRYDSYDFTLSGDPLWTSTLTYSNTDDIAPGDFGLIIYDIEIPLDAEKGDSDSFTVHVTSQGDAGLSRQITLNTVYPADVLPVFLPLVVKP